MKTEASRKLINPFIKECQKERDPYLVVHFSKEDDYFDGTHEFMDSLDAMVVIKKLIKEFRIPKSLLMTAV